jgi:RNA polymerase-binding protein
MAERALRGTRLGATSYENDRNTDLAPRREVAFDCPKGHHFTVPFAAEAEIPATWECRICGATAFTAAVDLPAQKKAKPPRSHWDMLMERRTLADLEEVLAERLAVIRERRGGSADGGAAQASPAVQRKSA